MEKKSIDVRFLIAEVARRHGVLLHSGDPLFVGATINELLLTEVLGRATAAIETAQDQIAVASEQQLELAKKTAERLVTGAAVYVTGQMKVTGQRISSDLREVL